MHKINKVLFIIFFIAVATILPAEAADNTVPIRVGISNTNFQNYLFDKIEFNKACELEIMDAQTGYTVEIPEDAQSIKVTSENNLFRIYVDANLVAKNLTGPVLVRPKNDNFIEITGLKRKGMQAAYRGYIELTRSTKDISKFAIVNVLSLKNYLRGVVPNEMPVKFGLEALKAQTVAARNYAVTPRIKAYDEFDLCDSVACQVYFGANTEDALSDDAIEETNGVIALDKEDKPILALYSSTAGGYTEGYEFAFSDPETKSFPSNDIHYLKSVPDCESFETLETNEKAEKFYTSRPEAFDDLSPYYRWSKEWTTKELEGVLSKTLVHQSKTGFVFPALENSKDFGKLESVQVLQRGKSGKAIKVEIKTSKNTFVVQKELVIRRCFQKNGVSLPSANFVVSKIDATTPVYKFSGGGFGHGVGLSQWGAGKMASLGYTFDQILQHYYQGIKLATLPVKVYGNGKFVERVFYCNTEEAILIVKNPNKLSKLKITINDEIDTIKLKDESVSVDISKYLCRGENKIVLEIIDDKAVYSDFVEAFVIVKGACDE